MNDKAAAVPGASAQRRPVGQVLRAATADRLLLGAWLLAVLPVVVAAVRAVRRGWIPMGDDALMSIRAHDVFTAHPPLLGTWSSASLEAGVDLNHPGPLLFDILAVPVRVFGPRAGVAVGVMLVNVASKCGNTKQYKQLEEVYAKYKDQGLVILGFPCNDFGGQEPGTNEEIKTFCSTKYNVSFPMFDKLHVKGEEQHPLYTELTGKKGAFPGDVKWNFGKFLIGRDGKPILRIEPKTLPDSPEVTKAIEDALAKK